MDWFNKRSRLYWRDQVALNEQETAFAKYDPDRIVQELCYAGADIVAVYAANQYGIAYYPSAILPQHPGLQGRDYVNDLVTRLRANDKKIILYINWMDSTHAEWNMVPLGTDPIMAKAEQPLASWADPSHPNGRVQALPGEGWKFPCLNSPRRHQVVDIAEEIIQRYHPDGFHLDMCVNPGVCVCDYCRPALEEICGTQEITDETIKAHWNKFIDWRCECSASLMRNLSTAVRKHGVITAHNAFASLYVTPTLANDEGWMPSMDIHLSECVDRFLYPHCDLNATSINVRWQHAVSKPSWIIPTSTQFHHGHWPMNKIQWELYASACKANGAKAFGPSGFGAYPDTTNPPLMIENVKHGFDCFMQDADLDEGAESAAKVALVFSWATRRYHDRGAQEWLAEFAGWARFLIEEHIPYDILIAEDMGNGAPLGKYDTIILPNIACLGNSACHALTGYVKSGGKLIVTSETSLWDERGERQRDFGLAELLGISWKESAKEHFAIELPNKTNGPASGLFQRITSSANALSRFVSVDPAGPLWGTDPMPMAPTEWPALTVNNPGKGKACYVAFSVGQQFDSHGDWHIGEYMSWAIREVLPIRQLNVRAPKTVEVTLWRQPSPERTIIHLANRSIPWSLPTNARQITEILPVHDIEITIDGPYPNPIVSARNAKVKASVKKGKLKLKVPQLRPYAALVIEPGEAATET